MSQESFGGRIVADPEIRHGRPVIAGTRVPVEVILGALAGNMAIDEVCEEYDIDREDVLAVFEYARESVAGEEVRSLPA